MRFRVLPFFSALHVAMIKAEVEPFGYFSQGLDWGETWPLCTSGQQQSPIDLDDKIVVVSTELLLSGYGFQDYDNVPVHKLEHTILSTLEEGHIEVEYANGQTGKYEPIQFHMHSPSEHTINGEQFALELHMVHRDLTTLKPTAIIGFLFRVSEITGFENTFLDQIEPGLFDADTEDDEHIGSLHLATFLRQVDFREFYSYNGSFTTPPCTEGINWLVLKEPENISQKQFEAFNSHFSGDLDYAGGNGNNRAIQPLFQRAINRSKYSPQNSQDATLMDAFSVNSQSDQMQTPSVLAYFASGVYEAGTATLN